jgi:hypothetical protein
VGQSPIYQASGCTEVIDLRFFKSLRMKSFCLTCIIFISFFISKGQTNQVYCNPLDISYGLEYDHFYSADHVVVLCKDRYYLFTTNDLPGYRVSDDLMKNLQYYFQIDVLNKNGVSMGRGN